MLGNVASLVHSNANARYLGLTRRSACKPHFGEARLSTLEKLKAAKSRDEVAALLGFKPSRLKYILYVLSDSKKYVEFEIAKRSGGTRKIKAPEARLAARGTL